MKAGNASEAEESERPKIAEKVKFWEEQDRINQELIPRVLKQHDLLSSHIENHETASLNMASVEARVLEAISLAREQYGKEIAEQTATLEASVAAAISLVNEQSDHKIADLTASLEARIADAIGVASEQGAQLAADQDTLLEKRLSGVINSTRRLAWVVSGVSLAVAVVAMLLVLVV